MPPRNSNNSPPPWLLLEMSGIRQPSPRHACPLALSAAAFAALIGCHTSAPRVTVPDRAPPPAETDNGSYDWHGLLVAPFGAVLKAVPIALHEVLLFKDDAHGSSAADSAAECYAADEPAPSFFGRVPDEYLLCFTHDHLSRIQASVRVSAAQASAEFAAACAVWLKNAAAAGGPAPAAPSTEIPGDAPPEAAACEGRDGAVHFKGSLGEEPGPADGTESESVVSVTLDSPPGP
jgi:hypothetical protein